MEQASGAEHERLEVLIGRWKTDGQTREMPDAPAMTVDAVDTYEWAPGGFALLHTVEAKMGDEAVEGAELIGYDPDRAAFITQYFGSDGPGAYEAELEQVEGATVWRMRSESDRFTGTFNEDGNVINGHWEARDDDGNWRPWMDITLTKAERLRGD
jgi:Protein of unknown function (DUF1579)